MISVSPMNSSVSCVDEAERGIGRVDAVDEEVVLGAGRARERHAAGARLGGRARGEREHGRVGAALHRRVLDELVGDRGLLLRVADVDGGRLLGDAIGLHLRLLRRDGDVDRERLVGLQDDAGPLDVDVREVEADEILARRQLGDDVVAVGVGELGLLTLQRRRGDGDGDAGELLARRLIGHGSFDRSRDRGARRQGEREQRDTRDDAN